MWADDSTKRSQGCTPMVPDGRNADVQIGAPGCTVSSMKFSAIVPPRSPAQPKYKQVFLIPR